MINNLSFEYKKIIFIILVMIFQLSAILIYVSATQRKPIFEIAESKSIAFWGIIALSLIIFNTGISLFIREKMH